jgi:hypothetical protein
MVVLTEPVAIDATQITLVLTPATMLRESNIRICRQVLAQGYTLVVVTTSYPFMILRKLYEQQGLDLSRIYFIDAITRYSLGSNPDSAEHCRFVSNPSNLTDLGIAITEQLHAVPDDKICLFFDSVSTLVLYLPSESISKFIHFVTTKLRLLTHSGIFLAVEKGLDPMLLTQVTTFVDSIDFIRGDAPPPSSPPPG